MKKVIHLKKDFIAFYYNFLIVLGGRIQMIVNKCLSKYIIINVQNGSEFILLINLGTLLRYMRILFILIIKIDLSKIFNSIKALKLQLESIIIENPRESENNNPMELSIDLTESIKKIDNNKKNPKEFITLYIKSSDQSLNCKVSCDINDRFNAIVNKIIEKDPSIIEKVSFILCNGNKINEYKTVKDNKMKDGDVVILNIVD